MALLIQYTLIFTAVLILVALGGMFSERSGIINLGLEGIMVFGAMSGAIVMVLLPSGTSKVTLIVLTLLAAAVAGMLSSLFIAVACINFKADQTLIGTALNMLATACIVSGDDPSANYVQLPTETWSMKEFTVDDYKELVKKLYDGDIKVNNDIENMPKTEIKVNQFDNIL